MPIYEYEPIDAHCEACEGGFETFQHMGDDALTECPVCGAPIKRLISQSAFAMSKGFSHDKAAQKGFTTWRRAEYGRWEKVAGEGVDVIVGDPKEMQQIKSEKKRKVIDLDKT